MDVQGDSQRVGHPRRLSLNRTQGVLLRVRSPKECPEECHSLGKSRPRGELTETVTGKPKGQTLRETPESDPERLPPSPSRESDFQGDLSIDGTYLRTVTPSLSGPSDQWLYGRGRGRPPPAHVVYGEFGPSVPFKTEATVVVWEWGARNSSCSPGRKTEGVTRSPIPLLRDHKDSWVGLS